MVRRKRKDRPGLGYLLRLEWSPEVVVAYFVGWVVGYVGRLWSVTLARWFRASAGKPPKAGRFPTRTPPALYPGPHPPYPTRYDKGHTRGGHPPPYGNATDETRDLPTHPTRRKPKLERNPGAQPANPHPSSPPRRQTNPAATRRRGPHPANPPALVAASSPKPGSASNPPIPDQSGRQTDRAGTRRRGPNPANLPALVAARHPSRDPYHLPLQDQPTQAQIQNQPTSGTVTT